LGSENVVELKAGDIFPDIDSGDLYSVEEFLGGGGFGYAYRVIQKRSSDQSVAKIPLQTGDRKNDAYRAKKLDHEARILAMLQRAKVPNIVQIKSHFKTEINGTKIPALLLELARGKTCKDFVDCRESGCLAEDTVKSILDLIGAALIGVHKHGIIHRDVTPDNVFVDDSGKTLEVTLIDFGIAAMFDNAATTERATTCLGKQFYSPPEQMQRGIVSPSSDVFSLAATGFYLATGKKLGWTGKYDPKKFEQPGFPISDDFSQTIIKATWPEMSKRYATVDDFLAALKGRPPIHRMPRIVVDGKSYPIDGDLITIGRAGTGISLDIGVSERAVAGKSYISRQHCYIRHCDDGYYRLFDGSPGGKPSTNKTIWLDKNNMWREIGPKGVVLGSIALVVGLGFKEGGSNERDIFGDPILPGPYRTIEYRPPDADASP